MNRTTKVNVWIDDQKSRLNENTAKMYLAQFYEPKRWEKQRSEIQTEKRGQAHRYDDKQGPNKKRADTQADSHIENERPHLAINSYSKLLLNTYCNIISLLKLG